MHTTAVMNAKGGVGKTTIATNLASFFAAARQPTTILDYDPQGSSLQWLSRRPPEAPAIHGADGAPRNGNGLKSHGRFVPRETRHLILDAPAGPSRLQLRELMDRTNAIVIPVAPSRIDIHATANFIKDLLLICGVRYRNIRVAVVANRARSTKSVYEPLERFVRSLGMTFLAYLLDSDVYIEAGDTGLGVFEIDPSRSAAERRQFMPIVQWVDPRVRPETPSGDNVVPLSRARAGFK